MDKFRGKVFKMRGEGSISLIPIFTAKIYPYISLNFTNIILSTWIDDIARKLNKMLEYLYAQVYVTRKVSKGVSHENTEERSASIFFFSFSARNQISDQGLGDWQRLDVRWMAWNCKIIRFSRTDSAIKCYRGVETVSCLSSLPLSLLSPPSPGGGTGHAMQAGRMHRRCNVCRSNRLYNEMNACSLLTENIERS